MNKTKKRHKKIHHKGRILASLLVFSIITISLSYNFFNNIITINNMKHEKITLNKKIDDLEKEKKTLEVDILKLKDPDYIARYVREKYFYSKEGELILRIDE